MPGHGQIEDAKTSCYKISLAVRYWTGFLHGTSSDQAISWCQVDNAAVGSVPAGTTIRVPSKAISGKLPISTLRLLPQDQANPEHESLSRPWACIIPCFNRVLPWIQCLGCAWAAVVGHCSRWSQNLPGPTTCSNSSRSNNGHFSKSKKDGKASKERQRRVGTYGNEGNGDPDDDDGDDGGSDPNGDPPDAHNGELPLCSLACPFYKLDPIKYFRCYRKYSLKRYGDVKQHLERCHSLNYYCAICWESWTEEAPFLDHFQTPTCSLMDKPDSLDGEERQKLQSLAPRRRESDGDKWYRMWDALFRGHARPASPYVREDISEVAAVLWSRTEPMLQADLPDSLRGRDMQVLQGQQGDTESLINEIRRCVFRPLSGPFSRRCPPLMAWPDDWNSNPMGDDNLERNNNVYGGGQ
ncbi:hypothetical protein QQS21_000123 [Conoideocrella luteorostrata]|uniref:Uncharacterized protein n=1 Tax=Conoideocrella luteorostrata TaxID=1105319 RepID=A0AAJ0FYW0_9HYPO|nr:hypothetical protein QQS21_000123 [Conoideocrella luteorostrata]